MSASDISNIAHTRPVIYDTGKKRLKREISASNHKEGHCGFLPFGNLSGEKENIGHTSRGREDSCIVFKDEIGCD